VHTPNNFLIDNVSLRSNNVNSTFTEFGFRFRGGGVGVDGGWEEAQLYHCVGGDPIFVESTVENLRWGGVRRGANKMGVDTFR
jgi:hypothetical protein